MADYDPESELDHFKFWEVEPKDFPRDLNLKGQFEDKEVPHQLERLVWIANPVEKAFGKEHHSIRNIEAHLLGFNLEASTQPTRWVRFKNQIEKEPVVWNLGDPALLLVPASKVFEGTPPEPPTVLDHFVCYLVRGQKPFDASISLEDQFDKKFRKKKENVKTLDPVFFCVPVSKNKEAIKHERAHLALYNITPRIGFGKELKVSVRDQFKVWNDLEVKGPLMLGVPTEKIQWGVGRAAS